MKIVRTVQSPKKLGRFLFRIPVYIYRLGLGGIFGGRLLVLYHRGRVTGRQRQTVLEVVSHDITDDSYVVASGFGTSSMWYRNVIQTPEVSIQVGRHTLDVVAMPVPKHEGADIFAAYATRHRLLAKYLLPRLLGFEVDGSEEDFRAAGQQLPFIRFLPRHG
ncbi:nitroreductase family deazaflavin-dependent oxidoreductase [Mycolicibacterium pallens]|uniref:Nitroreductase family deazaflavin-dependent oxidoreductase n=1 Tax=Mycolicibacterium pallens TaxID=370524 RepID=A0ABX8VGU5_9MYCO|nr:nitroreductase [Mycobacterium sp. WY10]QYL14781.1 nitroreductase family deazaflavin-dependent oxidoreductase [Mycolicibacterium pallens]